MGSIDKFKSPSVMKVFLLTNRRFYIKNTHISQDCFRVSCNFILTF